MHGENVYVAETARDTVLVFRKYHPTSRHTLPLSLLPLASCQVLLPGADGPATLPYALCLLLLSSRRFSLQCTMVVMYRCMQE